MREKLGHNESNEQTTPLEKALAKLTDEDRRKMQAEADIGLAEDFKSWPEY